jgi:carbonic anhydrase/acetyltransferase-like protein (isoleucine patch superfamily)
VMHRGALVSAGTNMMGCAVGHDCQVLMRATTYPGREVPNGYWILGPPHDVIAKIPSTLPVGEPLVSDGGVLRPWSDVKKGGGA